MTKQNRASRPARPSQAPAPARPGRKPSLSLEQLAQARLAYEAGTSSEDLAERYGIHVVNLRRLLRSVGYKPRRGRAPAKSRKAPALPLSPSRTPGAVSRSSRSPPGGT